MKTKKLLRFWAIVIGLLCVGQVMALDHGSICGSDVSLYPIRDGAAPGTALQNVTFDFKVVTVGSKTWAWTNVAGLTIAGNSWSSQLRYYPYSNTRENLLTNRISGTQQTYGVATVAPNQNPLEITFLQEENNNFYETASYAYDYTKQNSADAGDNTAPELEQPVIVNQTALVLELSLSATDDSDDFFYYIVDEANNFSEVSFLDNVKLSLVMGIDYNFSVYAIDFSGNVSAVKTVSMQAAETVNIVEGIARALTFTLDSRSLTELVIACTSNDMIGDAFVKISVNGTEVGEWKPDIDTDTGTKNYQIRVPASGIPGWAEGVFLGLNLGYIIMPIGDWNHYVLQNTVVTEGANIDCPIFHKIGTGVDIAEPEPLVCDNNLFSSTTFSQGTHYFATGENWEVSTNYTADVTDNEFNLYLGDATINQWQAQFRLIPDVLVAVTPGTKYAISMDVETTKDLPVYAKLMDADDNTFLQITTTTIKAPEGILNVSSLLTCPTGLTQISQILFDFAGNAADTDIKISNITLCDKIKDTVGLTEAASSSDIVAYQANGFIIIHSGTQIKEARLYTINGQLISSTPDGNAVNVSGLPKGIYLLKIQDVVGNQQIVKVPVR